MGKIKMLIKEEMLEIMDLTNLILTKIIDLWKKI